MLKRTFVWQLGILIIISGFVYSSTLEWLLDRYVAADSYYSHGFLIPFVSGYLIWLKLRNERNDYKNNEIPLLSAVIKAGDTGGDYRWFGFGLIVFALALHIFSIMAEVFFVSGYSLFILILASSIFLYGWRLTKKILFPLAFLLFMFPLPLVAVNAVSFPLKMLATKIAVFIMKDFFHLPLLNNGFEINFPRASLVVGNPCSGLRSLISLLALSSVLAFFMGTVIQKRFALIALSVPIAIISNVFRIILLSLAAFIYGSKAAQGFFHDFSGYVVFLVEFGLLWYMWRGLSAKRN